MSEGRRVEDSDHLERPGDFSWASDDGVTSHILLLCPACGAEHCVPVKPGRDDGWEWNGDRDKPTLSPSIYFSAGHGGRNKDCRWHGWLRNGEWHDA